MGGMDGMDRLYCSSVANQKYICMTLLFIFWLKALNMYSFPFHCMWKFSLNYLVLILHYNKSHRMQNNIPYFK
jgi:hypothetical protein